MACVGRNRLFFTGNSGGLGFAKQLTAGEFSVARRGSGASQMPPHRRTTSLTNIYTFKCTCSGYEGNKKHILLQKIIVFRLNMPQGVRKIRFYVLGPLRFRLKCNFKSVDCSFQCFSNDISASACKKEGHASKTEGSSLVLCLAVVWASLEHGTLDLELVFCAVGSRILIYENMREIIMAFRICSG